MQNSKTCWLLTRETILTGQLTTNTLKTLPFSIPNTIWSDRSCCFCIENSTILVILSGPSGPTPLRIFFLFCSSLTPLLISKSKITVLTQKQLQIYWTRTPPIDSKILMENSSFQIAEAILLKVGFFVNFLISRPLHSSILPKWK